MGYEEALEVSSQGSEGARDVGASLRERVALHPVDLADAAGLIIPSNRSAMYRGWGDVDYVCGTCGALLCIGVRRGLFRALLFACGCGALNRVP